MSKFKVGDKVKVISDEHYMYIKNGEIHEVVYSNYNYIGLKDIGNELCMYEVEDFELATPKSAWCISLKVKGCDTPYSEITVGKQYEIIREDSFGYIIKNDSNRIVFVGYPKENFSEEKPKVNPIKKRCDNCKYNGIFHFNCISCGANYLNFTPKQQTPLTPKTYNLIIVTHENDTKRYLFMAPQGVEIKQGDMLYANTRKGKKVVKAQSNSFPASVEVLTILCGLMGAKLNGMKTITGRAIKVETWEESSL